MVRYKNRYVVVEIIPEKPNHDGSFHIQEYSLYSSISSKVEQLYGEFGVAAMRFGFVAKYCNSKTRIAMIRTRHGPHRFINSAIPLITMIDGKRAVFRTLFVGATMKRCFKFIIEYHQKKVDEFCAGLKTDKEREAMKKQLLNFDKLKEVH